MKKVVIYAWVFIIFALLLLTVALPYLIFTFKLEKSLDVVREMVIKLCKELEIDGM
mgnify:CR=1 FL=1|jgi:hypothetical protein